MPEIPEKLEEFFPVHPLDFSLLVAGRVGPHQAPLFFLGVIRALAQAFQGVAEHRHGYVNLRDHATKKQFCANFIFWCLSSKGSIKLDVFLDLNGNVVLAPAFHVENNIVTTDS